METAGMAAVGPGWATRAEAWVAAGAGWVSKE